jgi:hypothetical protein
MASNAHMDTTKIWATVLLDRSYLAGVLVLNHTLRKTGTKYALKVVMSGDAAFDAHLKAVLTAAGIGVIVVGEIEARGRNGQVIGGMWQKFALWKLTEYKVYNPKFP